MDSFLKDLAAQIVDDLTSDELPCTYAHGDFWLSNPTMGERTALPCDAPQEPQAGPVDDFALSEPWRQPS